ncbi:MAG: LacI family DNA-binding transcriptional regulator [Rhizobiaceae bacterium]
MPTIQDVARAANVSTATVSRALSYPERVSEETRRLVIEAIERTGYRVNQMARNLRRQQTDAIVVLVPNLGNPFFSRVLAGIESTAARAGYNVLIADSRAPHARDGHLADYLDNNRADGMIVLDGAPPGLSLAAPARPRRPIVFCCEWDDAVGLPSVRFDNAGGEVLAVRHLAELGHTGIGHVLGPRENVLTLARLDGFRRALTEIGLPERADWVFEGDFSLDAGVAAARRWLELAERPTAVTASSDQMACGFIAELHRAGVSVPGQVSVVGFDDIDIAAQFIPALTTVRQPRDQIGQRAAAMLLELIQGGGQDDAGPVLLPPELAIRESSGPAA